MRVALLLAAGVLTSIAMAGSASARVEGPWCAHRLLGAGFIENNCQMMTYDQCRANIFATGGAWCTQNPWYVPPQKSPARRKAKRQS